MTRWVLAGMWTVVFAAAACGDEDGRDGVSCWDLDGDGRADAATEDLNGDGTVDVLDCRVPVADSEQPASDTGDGGTADTEADTESDTGTAAEDTGAVDLAAIEARDGIAECLGCHKPLSPNMVADFVGSKMAAAGVGCVDCHADNPDIAAGNEGHRRLPRPETCATCHPDEYAGHRANRHSIASIRNYECGRFDDFPRVFGEGSGYHFTAEEVEQLRQLMDSGSNGAGADENPTAIAKCMQCHNVENRCDSCHTRHKFSTAEARNPAACATCHMGPDHPQMEMYTDSKHGVMYAAEGDTPRVPVCVDCHMPYNGKIFEKRTNAQGKPYVSHDLSETIAYGPVGGGTVRKGFVAQNGRVKFVSKEAAGDADYEELWYDWADGKVYTTSDGDTVAFSDIYVMSLADANGNGKQDYAVAQPADDPDTLAQHRATMEAVCTKCHAPNFAQERLLVADLIHENVKLAQVEALDLITALAAADIGPYDNYGDIPVNPETGDISYGANMKIRNLTALEREYFNVMKYDQVKTWKGAYHFNPDYTHWYGWTEMNMTVGAMGDMATDQVLQHIWISGQPYPGPAGDIWQDGMYQGVIFAQGLTETTQMENYYDKFPGARDTALDWVDATGQVVWNGDVPGDGIPDIDQPIDVDRDGTPDFVKDDGNGGVLPAGQWRAVATDTIVTFH